MSSWKLSTLLEPNFNGGLMEAYHNKGGFRIVETQAQMLQIPYLYRTLEANGGTIVYINANKTLYRLINNPVSNTTVITDWEAIQLGGASSFFPIGTWDPNTNDPTLSDSDAAGRNGQFYFVTGTPSQDDFTFANLFQGETVTLVDGNLVVSVGNYWVAVSQTTTWDSMVKPQAINDYVNGIVINHTHTVDDIIGLEDLFQRHNIIDGFLTTYPDQPNLRFERMNVSNDVGSESTIVSRPPSVYIGTDSPLDPLEGDEWISEISWQRYVYYNGVWTLAPGGVGTVINATNGLTKTGDDIKLGGTLTENTIVDLSTFDLIFDVNTRISSSFMPLIRATIGSTPSTDIPILAFRDDANRLLSEGIVDIYLGPDNGNPVAIAGGNMAFGQGNLKAITPGGTFFNSGGDIGYFRGDRNIAIGFGNGVNLIGASANQASGNILVGYRNLATSTSSSYNYVFGYRNMYNWTATGGENVVFGNYVAENIASGLSRYNTLIGTTILRNATSLGEFNTFVGAQSAYYNATNSGSRNTLIGYAVSANGVLSGSDNAFIGSWSGSGITAGSRTVAIGNYAGFRNGADENTYIGYQAGHNSTWNYNGVVPSGTAYTGTRSVFIGYRAGHTSATAAIGNVIVIGNNYQPTLVAGDSYFAAQNVVNLVADSDGSPALLTLTSSAGTPVLNSTSDEIHIKHLKIYGANYNIVAGLGNTIGVNTQYSTNLGRSTTLNSKWSLTIMEEGLVNSTGGNSLSIGWASTVGNGTGSSGNGSFTFGTDNRNYGIGSYVGGIGGQIDYMGVGIRGGFVHAFQASSVDGKKPASVPFLLANDGSFNVGRNTAAQTAGHGSLGRDSAILGGIDHNIPADSARNAIIGGNAIKARANEADQVYVPNLNIWDTPAIDVSVDDVLIWDSVTKQVKRRSISSLVTGLDFTNGLTENAGIVKLGGTLTDDFTELSRIIDDFSEFFINLEHPTSNTNTIFDMSSDDGYGYIFMEAAVGGTANQAIVNLDPYSGVDLLYRNGLLNQSITLGGVNGLSILSQQGGFTLQSDVININPLSVNGYSSFWLRQGDTFNAAIPAGAYLYSETDESIGFSQMGNRIGSASYGLGYFSGFTFDAYNDLTDGHASASFGTRNTSENKNISISINHNNGLPIPGILIQDQVYLKGAVYEADYSANFTARSLVDKEYVDNAVSGATIADASETVKGKIEIATQAETDAGTDDLLAVTPLKLARRARKVSTQNISGSVSIDLSTAEMFVLTLTAGVTGFTFTNEVVGKEYIIQFIKETTDKLFTWTAGKYRFPGGAAPGLTNPTTNGSAPAKSVDTFTALCSVSGRLDIVSTPDFIEN